MKKYSLDLDEDYTREEFVETMEELGFELVEEPDSTGETVPYVSRWESSDKNAHLQYVKEPQLGANFVIFEASNFTQLGQTLVEKLFWDGIDELYYDAEQATTHNEGVKALFWMTAGIFTMNPLTL
jgi:hypothetical protein